MCRALLYLGLAVVVLGGPSRLSAQSPLIAHQPSTPSARSLLSEPRLADRSPSNRLTATYAFYDFDVDFDPWHLVSAWYERKGGSGSLIGRINYANRFDESAVQFEAESWPIFSRRFYAYLNAGYSPSSSFPEWRFGGELYGNIPGAWEASGGFRLLLFDDEQVPMLAGSLGKYYGNYWTSLRPFLVFEDGGELSLTLVVVTRRYFVDADNYISFLVAYGDGPSEGVTDAELNRLDNLQLEFGGKHPVGSGASWSWTASYERTELPGERVRNRFGIGVGIERRF